MRKEDDGYVMVQRSLVTSDLWLHATLEQRGAMSDLILHASYCPFDYSGIFGHFPLGERQLPVTYGYLSKAWNLGCPEKARRIVGALEKKGFLTKSTVFRAGADGVTGGAPQCTILTVNALYTGRTGELAQLSAQPLADNNNKKKKMKKENISPPNPQTGETGGEVLSSDEKRRSRRKSVRQKVQDRYKELNEKWNAYISGGRVMKTDGRPFDNQESFRFYLPSLQSTLCNNPEMIDRVNNDAGFPLVRQLDTTQRIEFVELHFCHFITVCHIKNDMQQEEIAYLAYDLSVRCFPLNLPQVSYFFYCMLTADRNVGSPNWNTLSSQKINAALKKFMERVNGR